MSCGRLIQASLTWSAAGTDEGLDMGPGSCPGGGKLQGTKGCAASFFLH